MGGPADEFIRASGDCYLSPLSTGVALQLLGYSGDKRIVSNIRIVNSMPTWGGIIVIKPFAALKELEHCPIRSVEANAIIFSGVLSDPELFAGGVHGQDICNAVFVEPYSTESGEITDRLGHALTTIGMYRAAAGIG